MKVVLTVADTHRWAVLAESIEGGNTTSFDSMPQEGSESQVDSTLIFTDTCAIDKLAEVLKINVVDTVIVFYHQAEHYLAEAVRHDAHFESAAEQWQRTTSNLLQLQRKNRARLKLINIEQALEAPQAFSKQLALLGVITTDELADSAKQDVTLLAACQYIAQLSELLQLNNLLQASSLLLKSDNKIVVNVENIIGIDKALKASEQDALKAKKQLANQVKDTEEESSLLLMQLHQVQEEFERIFLDKKRTLVQQKQYQREVTKLEHKLRNTTADLASKNYRLGLVVQDVDEMKRSIFWKTGAPVRAVSKVFNKSKKRRQKIQNEVEMILSSEYFDAEWYLAQYPDVAESTISPAEHYLRFGVQEQRFPGPLFSGIWYAETYPDVAESGINPLLHYIKFGETEGRTASVKLLQDQSKRFDV
ncbi:MAG: hypothetical protein ACKVJE_18815 [Pseudomonadales bacterium]